MWLLDIVVVYYRGLFRPNSAVGAMEEAILNPADRKAPSATPCASAGLDENQKTNGEVPPTAKGTGSAYVEKLVILFRT